MFCSRKGNVGEAKLGGMRCWMLVDGGKGGVQFRDGLPLSYTWRQIIASEFLFLRLLIYFPAAARPSGSGPSCTGNSAGKIDCFTQSRLKKCKNIFRRKKGFLPPKLSTKLRKVWTTQQLRVVQGRWWRPILHRVSRPLDLGWEWSSRDLNNL